MDALSKDMKKRGILPPDMQAFNELSFGNDKIGGVAALDFGGQKLSMNDLRKRIEAFVKSGDVGDLARVRYVYFEGNGSGGTRFLTIWTDEHFKLDRLMPTGTSGCARDGSVGRAALSRHRAGALGGRARHAAEGRRL